ncbi:MAG: pyridoxamine kinase [Clostridia bacterium]|nr:pyridoxamine kinase [Clostridia bacterium]
MKPVKKVACIHDLSCYGRCAIGAIFPLLSALGSQVCPLPTALLSTHTGGFEGFTFLDLHDQMREIAKHWKEIGLEFDSIYSGFLGSEAQIETVLEFLDTFDREETLYLADPVMGDEGELYSTYTVAMAEKTAKLCEKADIITPNLTEAFILTGGAYNPYPSDEQLEELLNKLDALCKKKQKAVVITGIHDTARNLVGAVYSDSFGERTERGFAFAPHCDAFFPGTGEMLASILLGLVLNGIGIREGLQRAVNFISKCSFETVKLGTPRREGLVFEGMLDQI